MIRKEKEEKMIFAGIDIGSISTETVILGRDHKILAYNIFRTGFNSKLAAEKSLEAALKRAN